MSANIYIAVLIGMFLCHLLADYPLQGWLATAKAKSYWADGPKENKNDWMAALACHAAMWGIMLMIPIAIASNFELNWYWFLLPANIIIHYIIDYSKACKKKINLIEDQTMHVSQILLTWWIWIGPWDANIVLYGVLLGIALTFMVLNLVIVIIMDCKKNK